MYVLLYCGVCTGVRLLPPDENPIAVVVVVVIIIIIIIIIINGTIFVKKLLDIKCVF
jgi:hypothetical protein